MKTFYFVFITIFLEPSLKYDPYNYLQSPAKFHKHVSDLLSNFDSSVNQYQDKMTQSLLNTFQEQIMKIYNEVSIMRNQELSSHEAGKKMSFSQIF